MKKKTLVALLLAWTLLPVHGATDFEAYVESLKIDTEGEPNWNHEETYILGKDLARGENLESP